ncbi:hypothetical protein H0H93_016904 [Arthromyces matolae]|nr:hypothetical protein H0H93_016904 [Arthromyces matolae]
MWNDTTTSPNVRLGPALTSARGGIRTMIWSDDALYVGLESPDPYEAFEMIVPSGPDVLRSAELIMEAHPYQPSSGHIKSYMEDLWADPEETKMYPASACLTSMVPGTSRYSEDYNTFKELPNIIFIHPDSFWGLNVKDNSISTEILSCDGLRLPTLATMINTITRMTFDPPSGYLHTNMFHKHCSWIDDIWTHAFGKIEGKGHNGTLSAQEKVVLKDIFPENRPHFERIARFGDLDIQAQHREERRSILRKLG